MTSTQKAESDNDIEVTVDIVRKALEGASIFNDPELLAKHSGKVPAKLVESAQAIQNNYEQFRQLIWKQLNERPLIKKYFGRLIKARLRQKGILTSPIISVIFDDYQTLENRLNRVQSISGIESLRDEYRGSRECLQGDITDQKMKELLAEILTLDFLTQLDFTDINKVSRKDKSHIDIIAKKEGQDYAIDVIRKQEITGWEVNPSTNLENCTDEGNLSKIRDLIEQTLNKKDDQFCRAIATGTISKSTVKVVAIKTSDYGFANCMKQTALKSFELLADKDRWHNVDCVWLMPNTSIIESQWISRDPIQRWLYDSATKCK